MSAIGHTMASMSQAGGGKLNSNSAQLTSSKARGGNNNRQASSTHDGNSNNSGAGRGQNINHLLAFTLPPRISNSSIQAGARRPRRGGSSYVPFNKERYVNAQYRFLVKPTGDYTAYFADSDIYLNWSDILTILIPTTSALSTASLVSAASLLPQSSVETHEGAACPICLSRPTAPRMTKCGHVYCFPCILHYLTVHDAPAASGSSTSNSGAYHNRIPGAAPRSLGTLSTSPSTANGASTNPNTAAPKWKRCPVCWDAVYARDLKAVQWWDAKAKAQEYESECEASNEAPTKPASDEYLCMRLIERPHLTTLALPQSSTWPTASTSTSDQPLIAQHSAPWHFQPDVMTFGKFMLATPDLLLTNLNTDIVELATERELLKSFMTRDEVGLTFVDMAERKVQEQMEKVANELDTQSVRSRIGYARKELAEHYQIEQGNRERDAEAISRRQRKRLERERKLEPAGEGNADGVSSNGAGEAESVGDRESPEAPGAAQEFLDHQSRHQGGNTVNASNRNSSDGQSTPIAGKDGSKSSGPRTRRNLNPPAPSSSSFFFFQASSGQNIFLHPLDIKVLLTAYGSYAAFPRTLQVCVQGADEGSMNDEMRKRCKYLTHLSQGADIVFVEVDWDKMLRDADNRQESVVVSRSVLRMYDHALRQRRNRRRDRERREDRAKLRSEEQERNSRPPMATQPIGFGTSSRSPVLSAMDAFESGSFGSQSALSPGMQEALLAAGLPVNEFPSAAQVVHAAERSGCSAGHSEDDDDDDHGRDEREGDEAASATDGVEGGESGTTIAKRKARSRRNESSIATTVWGTPGPKGSFASALHGSTRSAGPGPPGHDESAPDWDAWLELEEDYIVGARNGNAVREGRGLNRQTKRGDQTTTGAVTPGKETATPRARTPKPDEAAKAAKEASEAKQLPTAEKTPSVTTTGGKHQKKKKLVLTSGGGGRGTR